MSRISTIPIENIRETFFVRQKLDDQHVEQLRKLYEADAKLPALRVTPTFVLIDGRHRLHALRTLERKAVTVEVVDEQPRADLIALALLSNIGGALPPAYGDIIHSIEQMLEAGMQHSVIQKYLATKWPVAVTRRYLADALSRLREARLIKAVHAVTDDGKTIAEACLALGVKQDALRAVISGKRKRRSTTAEFKGSLTTIFRSRGAKMGALMRKVLHAYEEGQLSKDGVQQIIDHLTGLGKQTSRSIRDLQNRFDASIGKAKDGAA
jgi:hypothetical protein